LINLAERERYGVGSKFQAVARETELRTARGVFFFRFVSRFNFTGAGASDRRVSDNRALSRIVKLKRRSRPTDRAKSEKCPALRTAADFGWVRVTAPTVV